jgi:predicted metallopeptidase
MPIKYYEDVDLKKKCDEIIDVLEMNHIYKEHVAVLRSRGSKSRGTIARCHSLGKAMIMGMGRKKGFYLIELISEKFDRQSEEDKIKTLIHELMHIPKTFGGGFIHHNKVNEKSVDILYREYLKRKKGTLFYAFNKKDSDW